MRQAGILDAAGIHALDHHMQRLTEDHLNARLLAEQLCEINGFRVNLESVQTNIVIVDIAGLGITPVAATEQLARDGLLVVPFGKTTLRAVTHLDVDRQGILTAIEVFRKNFSGLA